MSNKYVFDDYGIKYPALDKDEILASIGAGGLRECVFASCVEYEGNIINFNYSGTLPSQDEILRLLTFGVNCKTDNLTTQEVMIYLELSKFAIIFYYLDDEIFVSNGNGEYLSFVKSGVGKIDVYPREKKEGYFIKSNTPINTIKELSSEAYNSIDEKDDETLYIVDDVLYSPYVYLEVTYDGAKTTYSFDFDDFDSSNPQNYQVKLKHVNGYQYYLSYSDYINAGGYKQFRYVCGNHCVSITTGLKYVAYTTFNYEKAKSADNATEADNVSSTIRGVPIEDILVFDDGDNATPVVWDAKNAEKLNMNEYTLNYGYYVEGYYYSYPYYSIDKAGIYALTIPNGTVNSSSLYVGSTQQKDVTIWETKIINIYDTTLEQAFEIGDIQLVYLPNGGYINHSTYGTITYPAGSLVLLDNNDDSQFTYSKLVLISEY